MLTQIHNISVYNTGGLLVVIYIGMDLFFFLTGQSNIAFLN